MARFSNRHAENAQRLVKMRKLLRDLHPLVLGMSVTDEAPEYKTLLKRLEELI